MMNTEVITDMIRVVVFLLFFHQVVLHRFLYFKTVLSNVSSPLLCLVSDVIWRTT